ncbi:MAG: DegV family protein [Anaerolineales bacterium]
MTQTCIITDNSVQFSQSRFKGQEYVKILPLIPDNYGYLENKDNNEEPAKSEEADLANSSCKPLSPSIKPSELPRIIYSLSRDFHNLLFILPTPTFSPAIATVTALLNQMSISANVEIIDTQTISLGVGWLIQSSASAIAYGESISGVKHYLINKIPHIYTLIYFHNLLNLKALGLLDPDQALVGNILGIHPLVLLEKGQILPYQKIRTAKSIGDLILNYAHEFEHIQFLGLVFGSDVGVTDKKNISTRIRSTFPKIKTEFQMMNKLLDNILGTQSISLVLVEKD